MKPLLTMRFSREASEGQPAGARRSCFVSAESCCLGGIRKTGRKPRHCCCDRSTSRANRGRCRGNCDPPSALPSCGNAIIAAKPPSVCSHPCESVSLKGLPPRILSARHCSLKGCKAHRDLRARRAETLRTLQTVPENFKPRHRSIQGVGIAAAAFFTQTLLSWNAAPPTG